MKGRYLLKVVLVILFLSSCTTVNKQKEHQSQSPANPFNQTGESSRLNTIIEDLEILPVNGTPFRLSELTDKKATVFVMREQNCPISEKYGPRLVRLENTYSQKNIQFIFIYVGQVQTKKSAREDLKKFDFKGPYVVDKKQTVINALSAFTTGDIFILTPERRLIYRGPLDDQYHLLKTALKVKNHYVSDVLSDLLSGKAITPKELPAPGCIISRPI